LKPLIFRQAHYSGLKERAGRKRPALFMSAFSSYLIGSFKSVEATHVDTGLISEIDEVRAPEIRAYLAGALRDGTFNRLHRTWRIAQSDRGWLRVVEELLSRLGSRSWMYQEGSRSVWVVETRCQLEPSPDLKDPSDEIGFVRGYFDAEGGIPRNPEARFYIQLTQKNRDDLEGVRAILVNLGIGCGRIHNPSVRVDPGYWRFYVRSESHREFAHRIGSWHPRKRGVLKARFPVS
jgi:hypothetical protein